MCLTRDVTRNRTLTRPNRMSLLRWPCFPISFARLFCLRLRCGSAATGVGNTSAQAWVWGETGRLRNEGLFILICILS